MEQGFGHETLIAGLRDMRLPASAAGGMFADLAVAVGIGALGALVLAALLRLFFARRTEPPGLSLAQQISALDRMPEPDRRLAALRLLRQHAPERYASLAADLYAPDRLNTERLTAEVARLV